MKLLSVICLSFLLFYACNNVSNPKADPNHTALPHGDALPSTELSAEDKLKLAQAKGRKAEMITVQDIEQMFDAARGKLYVFSFWSLNCKDCKQMNESMQKIASKTTIDDLKIILINTDGIRSRSKVNTYIREKGIVTETYILNTTAKTWADGIHEDWNGDLPAVFLVNESEEINQLIQGKMEDGEFQAIVESLSL